MKRATIGLSMMAKHTDHWRMIHCTLTRY